MTDIDLDIENYSFDEILSLFKLPYDYGVIELKQAKKVVMNLHPDKSILPTEIYIFYKKCYNLLLEVFEFSRSKFKHEKISIDDRFYAYFVKNKNVDFNKEFNTMFERCYVSSNVENEHYNDILKTTIKKNKEHVENTKTSIILIEEPTEYYPATNSRLNTYEFDSSSLDDANNIKRVYLDETVIPIDETFLQKNPRRSNTLEQLKTERSTIFSPLNSTHATSYIDKKNTASAIGSKRVAYDLYRRQEMHEKKYNENISKYNLIGN